MERVIVQRRIEVPSMAARKRFGRYRDEKGKAEREGDVREDRGFKSLIEAWGRYDYDLTVGCVEQREYGKALSLLGGLDVSADDLVKFSLMLEYYQQEPLFNEKAGLFLSAAINGGRESRHTIYTETLESGIDLFGWRNSKDILVVGDLRNRAANQMERGSIVIEGNVGGSLGSSGVKGMKGGIITVKGDAGGFVGNHMEGGEIIIEGNAEDCGESMEGGKVTIWGDVSGDVGQFMEGGTLTIFGTVGGCVGKYMEGGVISIEGEMGSIGDIRAGKIYHKGDLIVDK